MERLSREAFVERFPVAMPAHVIRGIEQQGAVVDRDAYVHGIFHGGLRFRPGVKAIAHGIIEKSLVVEKDAVLYFDGTVKGEVHVEGAACISGIIGPLRVGDDAAVSVDIETLPPDGGDE